MSIIIKAILPSNHKYQKVGDFKYLELDKGYQRLIRIILDYWSTIKKNQLYNMCLVYVIRYRSGVFKVKVRQIGKETNLFVNN